MGGRPKLEDLSEKQWQALKLFEAGHTRKDVAARIGWGIDYIDALCAGNTEKAGNAADLFKKELAKQEDSLSDDTKKLIAHNVQTLQVLIKRVTGELSAKKRLNHEEKKLLGLLNNSLAKTQPAVKIDNLSYSYTSGLSAEEIIHEFTRLKSIAEGSFSRKKHGSDAPSDAKAASDNG